MKFAAVLAGASAVKAISIPNVAKRQELVPIKPGFVMKPFLSALLDAVNEGANLTDILTKPAGDIISVGIADIEASVRLGLDTAKLLPLVGGLLDGGEQGNQRVAESSSPVQDSSNSRIADNSEPQVEQSNAQVASSNAREGTNPNARGRCTKPNVRVEWRNMPANQRKTFINSVKCLWDAPARGLAPPATNRYEELVWVHQQMTPKVHQAGIFLLWHRYYFHIFARMLREECSYPNNFPMPWWDESKDAGNFAGSGLFTDDYFGALPPINNGQGTCITNGAFGNRQIHIGPGNNNQARCLSRGENKQLTANVNSGFVNSCNSQSTYAKMRECSEYGPHAYGHNGIGPVMAEVSASPSDPIFFMHHSFIDRNYKKWQDQAQSRWTDIYACAAPGNPCPVMGLDTVLSSMGLRPDQRVRDYLDTEGDYACYTYDY